MSSGPSLPNDPQPAFQYPGQGQAAQGALQGAQQLPNLAGQNYGQFKNVAKDVTSGAYGAPQIQGAGQTAIAAGNSLVPYATQTLQMGFDPQQQLYNQLFQQNTDQTRATEGAQGVSGTPYGAGVESNSNQNFNLNWQNAQLGRQQTAAGTAEGLLGQQGQSAQTGANLLSGIPANALSALSQLNTAGGQAAAVPQMKIQDLLAYLSGGTGASNAATSQYSAESSAALGQQQIDDQGLAGLGKLGGGLLNWAFPGGL